MRGRPRERTKKGTLNQSLRRLFTLVFVCSMALVFIGNFFVTQKLIYHETEDSMNNLLRDYSDRAQNWFTPRKALMQNVENQISGIPRQASERDFQEKVYQKLVAGTTGASEYGIMSFYAIFPNGKGVFGDSWVPPKEYNPIEEDYYKGAIKSNGMYMTAPYIDKASGKLVVTLSKAIKNGDSIQYVLVEDIYLSEFSNIFLDYRSKEGNYLFALDCNNNIIAHPKKSYMPTDEKIHNIKEFSDLNALRKGNFHSHFQILTDHSGKKFLIKTLKVPGSGWTIGAAFSEQVIAEALLKQFLILSAIMLGTLFIALFILNKRLAAALKPLEMIQKSMQKVSTGDLSSSREDTAMRIKYSDIQSFRDTILSMRNMIIGLIQNIEKSLNQMEENDMTAEIEGEYPGDFEAVKKSLISIQDNLNGSLGRMNTIASQVASSSEEVASQAQELAQGAEEQASTVQAVSASVAEISNKVNVNAEYASSVSKSVENLKEQLNSSYTEMQNLLLAMQEIDSKSNKIDNIIKTIEDIAFQTNILSLNAAVEAARAGEAGKGFAVVADEVRNLANKSAEAASSTAELIQSTKKSVINGSNVANQTAKSLQTVVEGSKGTVEMVQKIYEASAEQARSLGQITHGLEQISSVVQNNSATSEESAAASEELSGQAQAMQELLLQYRLKEIDREVTLDDEE